MSQLLLKVLQFSLNTISNTHTRWFKDFESNTTLFFEVNRFDVHVQTDRDNVVITGYLYMNTRVLIGYLYQNARALNHIDENNRLVTNEKTPH